eukprot:8762442-Pyramimonas_sp.AAC.1
MVVLELKPVQDGNLALHLDHAAETDRDVVPLPHLADRVERGAVGAAGPSRLRLLDLLSECAVLGSPA